MKNRNVTKILQKHIKCIRNKYIKDIIVTDEELIKTTTRKIKRNEEMAKLQ